MSGTQDPIGSVKEKSSAAVDQVKEKLSDAASHVRDTASDYGRSAAENIDRNVRSAAGAIESTANVLRSNARGGDGKVSELAQTAAGKLDSTAIYLQNFDTRELLGQLESWTKKNPGLAIASAAAIGFLVGLTLKRDSSYE